MAAIPPSFPAMGPLLVIFKNLRRLMRSISSFLPCDRVSLGHPEIIVRCQVAPWWRRAPDHRYPTTSNERGCASHQNGAAPLLEWVLVVRKRRRAAAP